MKILLTIILTLLTTNASANYYVPNCYHANCEKMLLFLDELGKRAKLELQKSSPDGRYLDNLKTYYLEVQDYIMQNKDLPPTREQQIRLLLPYDSYFDEATTSVAGSTGGGVALVAGGVALAAAVGVASYVRRKRRKKINV